MNSPSVVSTPMARPPSTTMRFGSVIRRNSPPRLAHRRLQRARERRGAAARHLRLGGAREQRRDVMAEAAHAQIDFAQPVEEQEAGLHGRMLELLLHEFKRRQRAHLQQAPAGGAAFQQAAPLVGRQRRRLGFPAPGCRCTIGTNSCCQRRSVSASLRLNCSNDCTVRSMSVHQPSTPPSLGQQRDIQLGLDVVRAMALKLEVRVPRHRRDRALEECVRVVQKARMARVFERRKAAAASRPCARSPAPSSRPCRDRLAGSSRCGRRRG